MRIGINTKKRFSELGLFYSAAIWGSTFFIVKDALTNINPVILVGYRFLIAAALLFLLNLLFKKRLFENIKHGLILGILLWFLYIPQTIGLGITTASNSGFITGLFVAFVPIFGYLLFKSIPSITGIIATFISLSGLWILTGGMSDVNSGDILTLVAAITYAVHILYIDKYLKAGDDPFVLCFQQFLLVGILSLITGLTLGLPLTMGNSNIIGVILFLAVLPTFSAFIIQIFAQNYVSPLRVSLIFAFEPVFAGIFAWTLGNEAFITHRAMGGLLIFIAMLVSGIPSRKIFSARSGTEN